MPKIPPIFVKGKIKLLWSGEVAGQLLALLVLCWCSAGCCSAMVVKPIRIGKSEVTGLSVTLVTLIPDPLVASACSCSVVVAPLFLKFYRNILWLIIFKKQ